MNAVEILPAHFSKLRGKRLLVVGPSAVHSMMTGVKLATQDRQGNVRLTYTDDTAEIAHCPEVNLGDAEKDDFNFFSIVSAVQAKRQKE